MSGKLKIGQLVQSVSGRDAGKYYLVWDVADTSRALLVDGLGRKADRPKKKNVKHLKAYPVIIDEIEKELLAGQRVSDLEVHKALEILIKNQTR
jgi:ribosomal protein L14E/L6E/L27E